MVHEPRLSDDSFFALFMFIGGSARDLQRERSYARWFAAVTAYQAENNSWRPMDQYNHQQKVPSTLVPHAPQTTLGEMQGLIEALFWLNTRVEQGILQVYSAEMITVDSLYVKGLEGNKFVAREIGVLAALLRHTCGA